MIGLPAMLVVLAAVLAAGPKNPSRLNPADGLTYQWISPGCYFTGCLPGDQECYGLERKREKIDIAQGFWIGRTEVTQAAYKEVMGADPSRYKGAERPVDSAG